MHYLIKYSGDAKKQQALNDVKEFIGEERFDDLTQRFAESAQPQATLELMISFAGVQGYPAQAWAEHAISLR